MALFLCCLALSCQLQQGTDGARGPGDAVGAVGATFHVATCAHWHGVGARATRATWKARPGNMTSGGPRMDMSNVGATHDHLGIPSSPRRLPLGVSLPSLPCSRDSHALSRFQPALWPGLPAVQQTSGFPRTLPLPVFVWPMCFHCMFTLSCPARARMPGIVLCLALLAHAWPALPPPSPSPLLIVCQVLETRVLFSEINFRFVLPFCGSTKRVGPFVLPQKGRPVPSLFLFFLPQILGSLECFLGSGFITEGASHTGSRRGGSGSVSGHSAS